jgi:hypothetical protein
LGYIRGKPLSAAELESVVDCLEWEVEESRYRAAGVDKVGLEYPLEEEPLFMTWEEYLAFEERTRIATSM